MNILLIAGVLVLAIVLFGILGYLWYRERKREDETCEEEVDPTTFFSLRLTRLKHRLHIVKKHIQCLQDE